MLEVRFLDYFGDKLIIAVSDDELKVVWSEIQKRPAHLVINLTENQIEAITYERLQELMEKDTKLMVCPPLKGGDHFFSKPESWATPSSGPLHKILRKDRELKHRLPNGKLHKADVFHPDCEICRAEQLQTPTNDPEIKAYLTLRTVIGKNAWRAFKKTGSFFFYFNNPQPVYKLVLRRSAPLYAFYLRFPSVLIINYCIYSKDVPVIDNLIAIYNLLKIKEIKEVFPDAGERTKYVPFYALDVRLLLNWSKWIFNGLKSRGVVYDLPPEIAEKFRRLEIPEGSLVIQPEEAHSTFPSFLDILYKVKEEKGW